MADPHYQQTILVHYPGSLDSEWLGRITTFVKSQSVELIPWTSEKLECCLIRTLWKSDYLQAVVWYHPTPQIHEGSWMFHAAVAKKWRGRWLTRRTLKEIFELPSASRLYASITSDLVESIWERLGFTIIDHPIAGKVAFKDA